MQAHIPGLATEAIRWQRLYGGASHLSYELRIGARKLVLRCRPDDGASADSLRRELRVMKALAPCFPCPAAFALCEDPAVLGTPFLIMDKIDGLILRRNPPAEADYGTEQARHLASRLFDTLRQLHRLDYTGLGLGSLGTPQGYVSRQVEGWCARYRQALTDDAPRCEALMDWLRRNQPADRAVPALIHNDYRFDNVVLAPDGGRVAAVLDWENCTIGDPLMDLGNSLAYWIQADDPAPMQRLRTQPSHLPGMPRRTEIVSRYIADSTERNALPAAGFGFYYVFGLFRQAVIAQRLYRLHRLGLSRNPRYAAFKPFAGILTDAAQQAIDRNPF